MLVEDCCMRDKGDRLTVHVYKQKDRTGDRRVVVSGKMVVVRGGFL